MCLMILKREFGDNNRVFLLKSNSIEKLKLQMKKDCKIAINNLSKNELLKDEKKFLEKHTT